MESTGKRQHQKDIEFIYKLQFQRGLNPMYIPFTKKGFILTVVVFTMIYLEYTGLIFTLATALAYWAIYRNAFDYKFNERERVWLFALWNEFITERAEKPFDSNPIIFRRDK